MIRALRSYVGSAKKISSDVEFSSHLDAAIRMVLQFSVFALTEWTIERIRINKNSKLTQNIDFGVLRAPADGTLLRLLAQLVVECENLGWSGISRVLWAPLPRDSKCLELLESEPSTIEGLLSAIVRRRNDGSGHGIPGGYARTAEESAIDIIIDRLEPILPVFSDGKGYVLVGAGYGVLSLKLLRAFDGRLYCIRSVRSTKSGFCKVRAQVQSGLASREDIEFEADDVLLMVPDFHAPSIDYQKTEVLGWTPLASFPDKMTEVFSGRETEIEALEEWCDDFDSRTLLVFGDGGMGKTTMVVEFLHRLLGNKTKVLWRPDLIFFYTAKRTRWGLQGLEVINPAVAGASDVAISLARALEGGVGREWYSLQSSEQVSKLSALLKSYGIERSKCLIVLDNAETLIQSDEDVVSLGKAIRDLSKHVGRVVVTSRRLEHLGSEMIEMPPLTEDECENLLRGRGESLKIRHISQAGSATLKQYSRRLGRKPLVLEVFVQSLCEANSSLEKAFSRVQQMQNQDLGEFLYADAWQRLGEPLRRLLILMSRAGEAHDEILLKLCAAECGVSVLEAQRAIDESRGIATVSRVGGGLHVTFSPEFIRFCSGRTVIKDGIIFPSEEQVEKVGRRYRHFLSSADKHIFDRTGQAFRHPLARAAYKSATFDQNFDEAEGWYELAVGADSSNAALRDRYAYFLMSRQKLLQALDQATAATQLDGAIGEFWFTRGIVESKMAKATEAIASFKRSQILGKEKHLCALQMAYAYLKFDPPDVNSAKISLDNAAKVPPGDGYRRKHLAELERVRLKVDSAERKHF